MIRNAPSALSPCFQALCRAVQPAAKSQFGCQFALSFASRQPVAPLASRTAQHSRLFSNTILDQELKNLAKWRDNMAAAPPLAKFLGYAGIIPFVVLSPPMAQTLSIFMPLYVVENAASFQVSYGACIASFLGAIHWGAALSTSLTGPGASMIAAERFAWSVLPCLLSWPATQMHPGPGSLVMSVLLPVIYYVDKRFGQRGLLPRWYMALRIPLTAAATFGMATTAAYYVYEEQERAERYHRGRQAQGLAAAGGGEQQQQQQQGGSS